SLHQLLLDMKMGDKKFGYEKFFSQKELHDMVETRYADENLKEKEYYINQLFVLDMFLRLRSVGNQLFFMMQSINLESKGFKNKSILGAVDQINNHNMVAQKE